jgi:glycosyltransferase involved in cell wall biosynthesis
MRILVLDQFSEPGGAQQCLLDLVPALQETGWSGTVAMPGAGEMFERVREAGFETARIACGPYTSGRKTAMDLARFAVEMPRLVGQIRRLARGADVVYVNGPRLLPASGAGLSGEIPVVFHSHSYVEEGAALTLARMALERLNARVIACCEFVGEVWGPGARVVYNGVAGPEPRTPRFAGETACATKKPARQVGCIGRIAAEKGQLEFVEAAGIIREAVADCRFVIHGAALFSNGDYERKVRAAAADLPVEFAGWTNDVYGALAELDVLLLPSAAHDATPRIILEAFAAGVPVVAFRSGGIPELIEHGVNGFLAGSTHDMAAITIRLLAEDRRRIIRAARETWQRRFTLDRYRQDVMKILNSAAAAPASKAAPASTGP